MCDRMGVMRVLFVHQNFSGQFRHIADAMVARGDAVMAIGGPHATDRPGVGLHRWRTARGSTPGIFPPAVRAEADLLRGHAAARTAADLKQAGFVPDVIIGHPGWGETLHLRAIFPSARLIVFGEFFYHASGADIGFDAEFDRIAPDEALRITAKNATLALACATADRIVCPTPFQASLFPPLIGGITVLHEGLDLTAARRIPDARIDLGDGTVLDAATPLVTFVSRNLEPLRGLHIFLRALPAFLAACPQAHVAVIGDSGAGYGYPPPGDGSWKDHLLAELGPRLDLARVHFLGAVPHARMVECLSLSSAHVYYTYPFVLSWSLIEAMACECLILGSDTPPVRDAVTHGVDGLLNPFFDVAALSRAMIQAVEAPDRFIALRQAARATALARFDRVRVGVPGWLRIVDEVLGRSGPAA